MTAIKKDLQDANTFTKIAAVFGADILLDGTTQTVHTFNEKARDYVEITKPLTKSVAEFAALAVKAGFNVWGAVPQGDGDDVKFGPITGAREQDDSVPDGVAIN